MQRCKKCILPMNYPGIKFNNYGICNYCIEHKERKYLGEDSLRNKILSYIQINKNRDYDCLIGFSGGRDSTYLLYYFVTVLKLKVLAYTVDNGFMPKETIENIEKISKLLNVDHIICQRDYLKNTLKHSILSLSTSLSVAMVGFLCTGCKLALAKVPFEILCKYNIPVLITGGTPFEGRGYKTDLLRFNVNNRNNLSLAFGYFNEIYKNPKWAMNLNALITQFHEFIAYYKGFYAKKSEKRKILMISPYYSYIKWDEKKVLSTLNKLDWEKNALIDSTWRGDCLIALLKSYLYKKHLGFNDTDDGLSDLIRDGQIKRDEALLRLNKENILPEIVINELAYKTKLTSSDFNTLLGK